MQLWFARDSEVSIREQLVTQIILGILSEDLLPGQRLPSTRELARRFRIHPNTVSAGFRQLEKDGWLELRHGSGVYVRLIRPDVSSPELVIDQKIAALFRSARETGVPLSDVRARLRHWLDLQPPDHFLLIEPDDELRRILDSEMQNAVDFRVQSSTAKDCLNFLDGAIPVALPNRVAEVRKRLQPGTELLTLQVSSVPTSLGKWLPAPVNLLVGVASRWPHFLKTARTFLQAAGFHPDSLLLRDAREPNWHRGLRQAAAVVCDSVTATELPDGSRAIPFRLLSDSSIAELRSHVEFIKTPMV